MSDTAEGTVFDIVEGTAQRGPVLPAEAPSQGEAMCRLSAEEEVM